MTQDKLSHPVPHLFPDPTEPRVSEHRYSWVEAEHRSIHEQLIQAAWEDDLVRVKALVAQGADINYQDHRKESCYLIATSEGYLDLLAFCLAQGASLTTYDSYGGNGMIRAAERGHAQACALLYHAGDRVDHVNRLQYTALTEAVIFGTGCLRYAETVLFLLAAGADPAFQVKGKALDRLADEQGYDAIAQLLRRAVGFPRLDEAEARRYLLDCYRAGDAGGAALTLRQHPGLCSETMEAPKDKQKAVHQQRRLIDGLMTRMRPKP